MFVIPMHPWELASIQRATSWEAANVLPVCKYRRHDKSSLPCPRLAAEDAVQCSREAPKHISLPSLGQEQLK